MAFTTLSSVSANEEKKCLVKSGKDNTYITAYSIMVPSGVFVSDTIDYYGNRLYILHYSLDVKRDCTVLYNIDLKTARQSTPQHEELDELAKRIETLLK